MGSVAAAPCSVNGRRSWIWAAAAQVSARGSRAEREPRRSSCMGSGRGRSGHPRSSPAPAFPLAGVPRSHVGRHRTRGSRNRCYPCRRVTSDVCPRGASLVPADLRGGSSAAIPARLTRRLHETQDRRLSLGSAPIILNRHSVLAGPAQPSWSTAVPTGVLLSMPSPIVPFLGMVLEHTRGFGWTATGLAGSPKMPTQPLPRTSA